MHRRISSNDTLLLRIILNNLSAFTWSSPRSVSSSWMNKDRSCSSVSSLCLRATFRRPSRFSSTMHCLFSLRHLAHGAPPMHFYVSVIVTVTVHTGQNHRVNNHNNKRTKNTFALSFRHWSHAIVAFGNRTGGRLLDARYRGWVSLIGGGGMGSMVGIRGQRGWHGLYGGMGELSQSLGLGEVCCVGMEIGG